MPRVLMGTPRNLDVLRSSDALMPVDDGSFCSLRLLLKAKQEARSRLRINNSALSHGTAHAQSGVEAPFKLRAALRCNVGSSDKPAAPARHARGGAALMTNTQARALSFARAAARNVVSVTGLRLSRPCASLFDPVQRGWPTEKQGTLHVRPSRTVLWEAVHGDASCCYS